MSDKTCKICGRPSLPCDDGNWCERAEYAADEYVVPYQYEIDCERAGRHAAKARIALFEAFVRAFDTHKQGCIVHTLTERINSRQDMYAARVVIGSISDV